MKKDESEETEVKKGIEWLKEEIEEDIKSWGGGNPDYFRGASDAYENVKDWLNQLDDSETLSAYWIEQKSIDTHVDTLSGEVQMTFRLDDLENLLVPKQELPTIPKIVAEVIEEHKGFGYDVYDSINLIIKTNGEGLPSISDWVARNIDKFARAWLDGYTVEEEQKYVVELPNPNNQLGRHKNVFLNKKDGEVFIDSASLFVNDITKYGQFALTEEEIKKDFEWAWAFAKRVEGLEE